LPVRCVKKRIEVYQREQINILEDFRKVKYNVLVATEIGEEGLDIIECGSSRPDYPYYKRKTAAQTRGIHATAVRGWTFGAEGHNNCRQ